MNATLDSCSNCFHYSVCGSASIYNDVKLCKQFIKMKDILAGPALESLRKELAETQAENVMLKSKLKHEVISSASLEREVKLLRIIKQTLEMASGMTFDI